MNIAQTVKNYYNHKDFKDNYAWILEENFANNEGVIINRIYDLFNLSNYETKKYLKNFKKFDKKTCQKIYDFILENFEDFIEDFSGAYVGYTSLESISFGEQEEQLTGIYNIRTKKDYTLTYLKKIFDEEGFYVSDNYAYYDLSYDGLHIDLLGNIELLDNFLKDI